jgi:phage terminase small subunit
MTQGEAAIAAGYAKDSARVEGSQLLNPRYSPLVVQYVGRLKEERLEKHKVTYDTHVAELARLREAALKKNSFSAAVNAETNRGKAGGLYIERKIIKHGKLEDMSEQELENKMKQILDDYAPILNVTPEASLLDQKPLQTNTKKKEKEPENIAANQTSNITPQTKKLANTKPDKPLTQLKEEVSTSNINSSKENKPEPQPTKQDQSK